MRLYKEIVTAVILLIVNTVYLIETLKLPTPLKNGEPGPAFYPFILCAILYIASSKILFDSVKDRIAVKINFKSLEVIRPISILLLTVMLIMIFETVGYWISVFLYIFFIAIIFELGRLPSLLKGIMVCLAVATVVTACGWIFFDLLFDLQLPQGVVGTIFEQLS